MGNFRIKTPSKSNIFLSTVLRASTLFVTKGLKLQPLISYRHFWECASGNAITLPFPFDDCDNIVSIQVATYCDVRFQHPTSVMYVI